MFKLFTFAVLYLFLLGGTSESFAELGPKASLCLNQTAGKGDISKNLELVNQLKNSADPLVIAWRAKNISPEAYAKACGISPSAWKKMTDFMATNIAKPITPKKIKLQCVASSLQREVNNSGFLCKNNQPQEFENMSSKAPCMTNEVVSYLQFAVNEAINCVSPGRNPIDARYIMKKFNNETGFNFFLGYTGGVGIGQLTSDPVKEVAGWSEKSRKKFIFNEGQANYILEELMASTKPSCQAFKKTIGKDLESPPPSPAKKANYCHWVSPGQGLARNLFYSIAYYRWIRDDVVGPSLARKAPQLVKDPDVLNSFTLVAYGPGGLTQAKALMDRFRINALSERNKTLNLLRQYSDYVGQTEEKMKELAPGLTGDSCVQ